MATPTASPTSISGAETSTSVMMESRATSITSGPLMHVPSPMHTREKSDRHPHDFFVGRDHLVAHRDQRLDGDLRLGHRRYDVDHVGAARRRRPDLVVGGAAGLHHGAERVLEHRAKTAVVALDARSLARAAGRVGHAGERRIGIGGSACGWHSDPPPGLAPTVSNAQARRMSSVRWIMRRVAPMTLRLAS